MINDFMYVLENYPDANLSSEDARKTIAQALANIMCEHHIVSYTDLESVKDDPKMANWIDYCKSKSDERDLEKNKSQITRGL